jgi:selenocysteine lyase/cysteine desulfurase
MKLPNQRHLYDIPEDISYLNCAYMSPLMQRVRDAGVAGLELKRHPWTIAPPDFFTGSDALREAFATLIHAEPEDIAIVAAASYGLSIAAKNLPMTKGQTVIVVEDQFPSNVYPWRERAMEVGASVRTLKRPAAGDWTTTVLDAIDDTIAVVALPQCHWIDGSLFDIERISAVCRDKGIGFAVDVTQSVGAMPLDVRRIQPDFLATATYKWLMGPYALGLLYVSKRWQKEGRSIEHNWIHRKNSDNFARLVDYQDELAPGAQRFDVGERSNFALVPAAEAGIRQVLEWGVENIAETLRSMTQTIAERAATLGLDSVPSDRRAGHYLGLTMPSGLPDDLPAELAKRNVFVSVRGSSIRVTPHLYNDERDIDRLISALADVTGK